MQTLTLTKEEISSPRDWSAFCWVLEFLCNPKQQSFWGIEDGAILIATAGIGGPSLLEILALPLVILKCLSPGIQMAAEVAPSLIRYFSPVDGERCS